MSPDLLLDLALGQLDEPERERAERLISSDPELAGKLGLLRSRLDLLLDDGPGPIPPPGLAQKAIARVERHRRWHAVLEYAPARGSFRIADVAVAAGIFIAGLMTLVPAVQTSQVAARSAVCASNLRNLGVGLLRYASMHNGFPFIPPEHPAPYAGSFVVHLNDRGIPIDPRWLDCPVNGPNPVPSQLPTLDELAETERRAPLSSPCLQTSDYAYNIGYRQPGATSAPLPANLAGDFPLLADRPGCDGHGHALRGNSPNHRGAGQNVLLTSGGVRFLSSPRYGTDPDIYHNHQKRTAPGVDPRDFVLGGPTTRFDGR